jgi:hypothetical protein
MADHNTPQAVAARIQEWIGSYGGENTATLLLYEAMNALKPMPAAAVADAQPLIPGTPERIYLIIDHDDREPSHFDELEEVCWCAHSQGPDDIEYVLAPQAPQLSGNPGQVADAQPVDWKALEARIDEFVGEYEMCGEDEAGRDGCYAPTDGERAMISDAIHGLLAEDEVMQLLRPAAQPSAHVQPDGMVLVNKQDANAYCLILRALGMEDEGDAVAEVERLAAQAQPSGNAGEFALPAGYSVKRIEGHGWVIHDPRASKWVAHDGTPAADFIAAIAASKGANHG